jgi:hypothetical protein
MDMNGVSMQPRCRVIRSVTFLFVGMLVCLASLLLWIEPGACMAGNISADEFKQKIDALKNLQEQVNDRIDTALSVRADLTAREREYSGEIKDVYQRHRYGSFAEAIRNPRVDYNLKLIQMVSGYTGTLDEKIVFFNDCFEQLRFLYRRAVDEFEMMQTLGALENAGLLDRIDRLLIEYRAELQKDLIVPAHISFRPCDAIWREIVDND